MNIPRISYFSKKEKEENEKDTIKKTIGSAALLGITGTGITGINGMKFAEKEKSAGRKFEEALKKEGEKAVTVIKDSKFNNSASFPASVGKLVRFTKKHNPEGYKSGLAKGLGVSESTIETLEKSKKPVVVIGKHSSDAALAHELGHSHYQSGKGFLGRVAHNLSPISNLAGTKLGAYGGGMVSGISSVKENSKGEVEVDKKKLLQHAGIAAALQIPLLVAEGAASRKGLQMLKKSGADKKALKEAKSMLGNAYNTYIGAAAFRTGRFVGGQGIGAAVEVNRKKKKNKK